MFVEKKKQRDRLLAVGRLTMAAESSRLLHAHQKRKKLQGHLYSSGVSVIIEAVPHLPYLQEWKNTQNVARATTPDQVSVRNRQSNSGFIKLVTQSSASDFYSRSEIQNDW